MKLTRYTSALAAFLLLTAAAQSIPVSAFHAPAVRSGIAAEEDTAPADETQKPLAEGTIGETITWLTLCIAIQSNKSSFNGRTRRPAKSYPIRSFGSAIKPIGRYGALPAERSIFAIAIPAACVP